MMNLDNLPPYLTLPCGHRVMVARQYERRLSIERLINLDGLYGTVTRHGTLYKRTHDELVRHLRFVFDVDEVQVVKTTLVE